MGAPPLDNPLVRSGLAFAGANRHEPSGDGVMTALEISGLDLRGTKLVVLSACETAVGDVSAGEGVYGMRRALVLAGAESQILSLWKVNDEATRDLIVAYYTRLLHGGGRTEALREAQIAMATTGTRAHPYFWASFIASGDWRSLHGAEVPMLVGEAPASRLERVTPGACGCGILGRDRPSGLALAVTAAAGLLALMVAARTRSRQR